MNEFVVAPPLAPPPTPARSHVAFANDRSGFRRLAMRGAMLELVTAGFYRFWLATDMRRHLWSHTLVDGDTAEYTGTGRELLIGFLFAVAILGPIYLAYFIAGLEAERVRAFASFPLGLFFYLFMQFAVYRARRYRLTRTVWRGVRFSMTGSGWNYAWRAVLWTMLAFLTLGLAQPWRLAALERFKMRHTSYGDLQGRFDGKGSGLFKRGWWLWLVALLLIVLPIALGVTLASHNSQGGKVIAVLAPFVIMLCLPFMYGTYKAIEWRWWVAGVAFGDVTFTSDLGRSSLFGLYWKVIGWAFLLMLIMSIVSGGVISAVAATGRFNGMSPEQIALTMQQVPVLVGMGLVYVVMALAIGVVVRIYLLHDLWRRVADTTTVVNLAAAENVTAQGNLVGAIGEGFADSLDVVGF